MEIKLSELETSSEIIITLWHVHENDRVEKGQDILEVTTDKAAFDVPSPCDGIVGKIIKKEGDIVASDEIIATIQEDRSS